MSRNKGFAPPPPARLKPGVKPGGRAELEPGAKRERPDSLVVLFDELTRNAKVLREGGEEQFLQFATCQEECRRKWQAAEGEVARVAEELHTCETEVSRTSKGLQANPGAQVRKLEMKLGQARDLLAAETGLRKKAEQDRDGLSMKWEMVRELIRWAGNWQLAPGTWHLATLIQVPGAPEFPHLEFCLSDLIWITYPIWHLLTWPTRSPCHLAHLAPDHLAYLEPDHLAHLELDQPEHLAHDHRAHLAHEHLAHLSPSSPST